MTNRIALLALALALPLAACEDTDDPVVMEEDTITIETPDVDGAMDEAAMETEAAMDDAAAGVENAAMEAEAAMEEGAAEMEEGAAEMEQAADEMEDEVDAEL